MASNGEGAGHPRSRRTADTAHLRNAMLVAGMNPAPVSRQMGHKNAKMFFEVYSQWIDGAANDLEKEDGPAIPAPRCAPSRSVLTSWRRGLRTFDYCT